MTVKDFVESLGDDGFEMLINMCIEHEMNKNNKAPLKEGDIVYVRNHYEAPWVLAEFVGTCYGYYLAGDPDNTDDYADWQYCTTNEAVVGDDVIEWHHMRLIQALTDDLGDSLLFEAIEYYSLDEEKLEKVWNI